MQEVEIWRISVVGQPGPKKKKVHETSILMEKSWAQWCMPIIPTMVGSLKQDDCGPGWPGQKARPYLKNNQSKED
jgi:hypothetical protein